MKFAPGYRRYLGLALGCAAVSVIVTPWLSLAWIGLCGFVLWFFRDPDRAIPPVGIVAPADGRITVIRQDDGHLRVGVFMNLTDVHVNRAPIDGTVTGITHSPGAHRPAFTKDSDRNERVTIEFDHYHLVLIAGWFARRITTYIDEGDRVARGQRIGHIAFGSRVDIRFPPTVDRNDLTVGVGDQVKAGETVIARNE